MNTEIHYMSQECWRGERLYVNCPVCFFCFMDFVCEVLNCRPWRQKYWCRLPSTWDGSKQNRLGKWLANTCRCRMELRRRERSGFCLTDWRASATRHRWRQPSPTFCCTVWTKWENNKNGLRQNSLLG